MSDFIAAALGLAFTLVVCLLALQAILSPWLRRRAPGTTGRDSDDRLASKTTQHAAQHAAQPDARPVQMV